MARVDEEREADLAQRYRDGNRAAGGELVALLDRWISGKVQSYRGKGLDREELQQEGRVAVLRAAKSFERGRGDFRVYASRAVRREVLRAIFATGTLVILPARVYESALRHLRAGEELPDEIAAALRVRFADSDGTAALNGPDAEALGEALVHLEPSPEDELAEHEHAERIKDAVYKVLLDMPAAQCEAIARRQLMDELPTNATAAASMGVSQNAFCHLSKLAIARLRRDLPWLLDINEPVRRVGVRRAEPSAMAAE